MNRFVRMGLWAVTLCTSAILLGGCAGSNKKVQAANVHRRIGEGYLSQMRVPQAMAEFQKGLELNPKDPALQENMGLALLLRQEFEKSEVYLKRALELDGSRSEARNHLAVVHLAQSQPAEALKQLDKALADKNFTSTGKAYFNQGKAYVLLDQPRSAIEAFEKAVERNPADIRSYLELSDLYMKQKDYRRAAFAAQRGIEFYPADYRVWFMLGKAMQAQNNRAGAIDAFQKTLQNAPENSEESIRASSFLKVLRSQ